jgi:hypothetical protein
MNSNEWLRCFKFRISIRGGHCDYSPRTLRRRAASLPAGTEINHESLITFGVRPRCDPCCCGVKRHLPWHHAVCPLARKRFHISGVYWIIVNPNGSVGSSIQERMAELCTDKWEQLPYPSAQGGEMTPSASVPNIRRFVCCVAASRNALQPLSCLLSPTLITCTFAE